jgi:hypothetical protein
MNVIHIHINTWNWIIPLITYEHTWMCVRASFGSSTHKGLYSCFCTDIAHLFARYRFEAAMKIQAAVFWLSHCSHVVGHRCFGGPCRHRWRDGGSKVLKTLVSLHIAPRRHNQKTATWYRHKTTPDSTTVHNNTGDNTGLSPWYSPCSGDSCSTGQQASRLYWNRRFITMLTKARHWALSKASSIKSTPLYPISLTPILILFSHLRPGLPSSLLLWCLPTNICKHVSFPPCVQYVPPTSISLIQPL